MGSNLVPRKAEKKRVKLKMAVQGPSGSGKTWGALALAKNLWPDAKVCLIDTENESASLYADKFSFDTIPLSPPFTTARYIECVDAVIKGGYDVLIIDSITPQWDGDGGILRRKEVMDARPGANSWANWAEFTPEHEAFKQVLLQCPVHLIATLRTKQDYILTTNEKGKQAPRKVGMAPIQRDGFDYEFALVFEAQMDHRCAASKDRTGLFNEKIVDLADSKTADAIREWLNSGVEIPVIGKVPEPVSFPSPFVATVPKFELQGEKEDMLVCVPRSVEDRKRVKKAKDGVPEGVEPFLRVYFNGVLDGCDYGSCFDTALFDLIRAGVGNECTFQVRRIVSKGTNFVNIEEVYFVGGKAYAAGKPLNDAQEEPVPDKEESV